MEAKALTELGANLALDPTTVTRVTVELVCGTDMEEFTFIIAVKSVISARKTTDQSDHVTTVLSTSRASSLKFTMVSGLTTDGSSFKAL